MLSKTTYSCDLCRKDIEPSAANGFAFCWDTTSMHELQHISDWIRAPFHFCRRCVRAMSNAAAKLDTQKIL